MDAETIVDFCRFLRDNGFQSGVLETLTAIDVGAALQHAETPVLQSGLKSALSNSKEQWDAFDALFDRFLTGVHQPKAEPRRKNPPSKAAAFLLLNGMGRTSGQEPQRDAKAISGASLYEQLRSADLSDVSCEDQAALDQIAAKVFRQAASRLSRRLKSAGRRASIDLRRTIHQSVGLGGEIVELRHKGRKPKKPRLVILLDVSGSMNTYSSFLLKFAYALQKQFRQTNAYVFSTQLCEITTELRSRNINELMENLSARPLSWSGGTKIGESLETFNERPAGKVLSRDTICIILSDGWDTGEADHLGRQLRLIRSRVRRLIWLNPLLGLEEYQPVTRGMAAALPHLDVFAPAHSLEALAQVERYLCSTNY